LNPFTSLLNIDKEHRERAAFPLDAHLAIRFVGDIGGNVVDRNEFRPFWHLDNQWFTLLLGGGYCLDSESEALGSHDAQS
jgi:hypothetical protein